MKRACFLHALFYIMNMNKLYILIFLAISICGYNIGDTISEQDLAETFSVCFGDSSTISFGNYKYNSVIWLNLSASW